MPRLKKQDSDKRRTEARRQYINGTEPAIVAKAVGVTPETVKRWAKEGEWDEHRDARALGIEQVNELIYKAIDDIRNGKTPKTSPDQIAKLVAAFEKLNDKQKSLRYGMQAFNILTDKIIEDINLEKNKTKQNAYFKLLQRIRTIMDIIIENWFLKMNL